MSELFTNPEFLLAALSAYTATTTLVAALVEVFSRNRKD